MPAALDRFLQAIANPWTAVSSICVFLTIFLAKALPIFKDWVEVRKIILEHEKLKMELGKLKTEETEGKRQVIPATIDQVKQFSTWGNRAEGWQALKNRPRERWGLARDEDVKMAEQFKACSPRPRRSLITPVVMLLLLLLSLWYSFHYVWKLF